MKLSLDDYIKYAETKEEDKKDVIKNLSKDYTYNIKNIRSDKTNIPSPPSYTDDVAGERENVLADLGFFTVGNKKEKIPLTKIITRSGIEFLNEFLSKEMISIISSQFDNVKLLEISAKTIPHQATYSSNNPKTSKFKEYFKEYDFIHTVTIKLIPQNTKIQHHFQTERMTQKNIKQSAWHTVFLGGVAVEPEDVVIDIQVLWTAVYGKINNGEIVRLKTSQDSVNKKFVLNTEMTVNNKMIDTYPIDRAIEIQNMDEKSRKEEDVPLEQKYKSKVTSPEESKELEEKRKQQEEEAKITGAKDFISRFFSGNLPTDGGAYPVIKRKVEKFFENKLDTNDKDYSFIKKEIKNYGYNSISDIPVSQESSQIKINSEKKSSLIEKIRILTSGRQG